ncbi:tRNA (adenosine(37)-N6)-threonylcarbamoyltransferase complex dimerization subunit type 1 TsaB [Desulfovibrio ferrophilus]|uniref:Peptidase M22 glycoprotease n=1 Tax=Desulfovibrio ferrophilus TaxID=241368 RepID=A0A2Z6AZE2_9BACT|nr:tRNA (adenosine(37)-N6)-threonylcarbamoyltransferase complex dimerization subunit type 1 TsaB [Desulfovibrio ferrophilus]BBD08634.1 peptidase M22 glycoprotease [Desulfovibrio ferrophilus]
MGKKRSPRRIPTPQLVLNGSEQRLQLVLAEDGELLASQELTVAGSSMQHLVPALQSLLDRLGLTTANLTGIACVRGPGSFTGLRMILATALGLSRAADIPMAGLEYLPLIAAGPAPLLEGTLAVITHSRSRQVYVQAFSVPEGKALGNPQPLPLDQAVAAINTLPAPVSAVGSGLRNNLEFFQEALPSLRILGEGFDHPLLHVLAGAAAHASYTTTPLEPMYLRASDAEDNLPGIAAGRGIGPEEALRRLATATSAITAPICGDSES